MQTASILPLIRIVPMPQCVAHEGVVRRWVEAIMTNLLDEGVMKNPIIVSRLQGRTPRWIVVDGMHRFAALRALEIRDILTYEIDYHDPKIGLAGWDTLLLRPVQARRVVENVFGKDRSFVVTRVDNADAARRAVVARDAILAVGDRSSRFYLLGARRRATVETCVQACARMDAALDADGFRPLYVPDVLSLRDFHRMDCGGLVMRPLYTKAEVIERTVAGKIFPRKSTRHLIPGRPLRVDVALAWLRGQVSLAAKNRLLREHLRWCYEADRIRYYPESVFVFAD
ncbi:MAG: hypothetical protein HY696_11530 [Deltaproteobacteria bacterium]|nr:hypothetical protein [Deltaproteobacteria bacterium]